MTLGMQLRLWYRAATTTQRLVALGAGAAVVALLVASVAVGGGTGNQVATGLGAGQLGGAAAAAGAGPGVAASGASASGPASAGGSGTGPGASGLGGAAASGSSAARSGLGATTGLASGTTATGGVSAGGGSSGTGTSGSTPVKLTASDRGVTPTTITIGFLPANLAGLSQAGFAIGVRADAAQYAQALGAYVNAHGGVDGRKVVIINRSTDPTSQSDQAAACQAMVSDDHVFGVVDEGAISDTPAMACIAIQNRTPFVHNTIWSTQWLAQSGGMEVGFPAAIDRISVTWPHDLAAMGWLAGHPTVGILGDQCEATKPVIDDVLQPELLKYGAGKVVLGEVGCDPQSVASEPATFATQFRTAGVTKVLLANNFVTAAVFMKAAQQQLYHPQYSVSDWWQLSFDADTSDFDPNQFNGAIAVTSQGLMLPGAGLPPRPGGALCSKVATDAGLAPLQYTSPNTELWAFCDNFFLMIDGLRAAGPNPTRTGWAAAVQHLGEVNSVIYGPSLFRPGKVTGSDQVFTARWESSCTCWRPVSGFRPASA